MLDEVLMKTKDIRVPPATKKVKMVGIFADPDLKTVSASDAPISVEEMTLLDTLTLKGVARMIG